MRPRLDLLIAGALAAALVASAARAVEAGKEAPSGSLFDMGTISNKKDPITISSDTLEYDYKNNVVVYRGDVQAVQGQVKVRSDTLRVTFDNTKDPAATSTTAPSQVPDPAGKGQQKIHEVTALGSVRIDQGTKWATGGKAVFDQSQRTLVLTQTPVLHDGPNEVAGDRVIVYLDENRSVVEGGRKRVKAVLYPGKDGGLAGAAEKTPAAAPADARPSGDKTAAATDPGPTAQP